MITKPKGTYDVIENNETWLYLEEVFYSLCNNYNYNYIRTPIFESSELFHRGIGEGTDIISKETYDFKDKGDRNLTLRPELTAGIVRSYIENKLYANPNLPHKFFTFGPAFRYERPQHGRNREFYQAGVEAFGTKSALLDAEVISIGYNYLTFLGLDNITVRLNSIGDNETRTNYKQALLEYLNKHKDNLCEDCQNRMIQNPLRVLDCKTDKDNKVLKNVPSIIDYLNDESKTYFNELQLYLEILEINYEVDNYLVRGLDYYTDTIFEYVINTDQIGNQNVAGGGGRYDNLVKTLDGPDTPGVGFGFGIDRIIEILKLLDKSVISENGLDVMLLGVEPSVSAYLLKIADALRMSGFKVDLAFNNKNLSKNLKNITNTTKYIAIIGEDEIKSGMIKLKDNQTGIEESVDGNNLIEWLGNKCK